jgi:flagellar L-ring protein precursor FlgH
MKINRMPMILAVVLALLMSFCLAAAAQSLWNPLSASPYTTQKSFKTGDLITVIILEVSSAAHKAGTDTSLKDELGASFTTDLTALTRLMGTGTRRLSGSGRNVYKGSGGTVRSSNVSAKVAAFVEEILPNGNLKIAGKHSVVVNDETQEILVSGIVRPKDVTLENTILSYQVANAHVEVKGTGIVQESAQPGWITRFINWIF